MKYSKGVKKVLALVIPICIILTGLIVFIIAKVVDLEEYSEKDSEEITLRTEEAKNNQTQLLLELGQTYEFKGDYQKAIEAYKYTLNNNPTEILAWLRLSQLYIITGNFDEALFASEKAVELDPENPYYHFNNAKVLLLYDVEEAFLAIDKYYDLCIQKGLPDLEYLEKINTAFNAFESAYRKENLYSAYTNLFNSEIYIENPIKVGLLNRLIESSALSNRELKEIEAIKANLEKSIAEGLI